MTRRRVTGSTTTPEPRASSRGLDFLKAFAVIAPLTSILFYYFGWLRSNAIARHWGYTTDMIGLSHEDYLLRSISATYRPVVVSVLLLLVGYHVQLQVRRRIADGRLDTRRFTWPGHALVALGAVLLAVAALRLPTIDVEAARRIWFGTGSAFVVGAACVGSGLWLLAAREWSGRRDRDSILTLSVLPAVTSLLVVAVALVGVFVLTLQFATRVGNGTALRTEAELAQRAEVVVYSGDRLYLSAAGVSETRLDERDGAYRWRYDGLRLLSQTNGTMILLPAQYADGQRRAFVVPVTDGVRLDLDRS